MKILYLHQYFTPPNSAGGTRSYEFARRLILGGYDVTMVTSSAYLPPEYQKRKEAISKAVISDIPSLVINVSFANEMNFFERISAFFRFAIVSTFVVLREPADIIFATSTPLTIAIPAIIGKLWKRIPMVFEVRDLWPELPIAIGALQNPLAIWAARRLEKLAYTNAHQIVALSPGMKNGIVKQGFSENKVHIIPNSCDVDDFSVPKEDGLAFRQQFDWLGNRPLVVYAGTLGVINGVGYLARLAHAVSELNSDIRFLIIGRGGREEESIRALAKKLGVLDSNFFMIPQIEKREMPAALSAADVVTSLFIDLPEMENNSANKFFDGLASGTAIAINYGGWQAELLQEFGAGFQLHPTNLMVAAHDLIQFLEDEEQVSEVGSSARELANQHFDRDDMAAKLEKVLKLAHSLQ